MGWHPRSTLEVEGIADIFLVLCHCTFLAPGQIPQFSRLIGLMCPSDFLSSDFLCL